MIHSFLKNESSFILLPFLNVALGPTAEATTDSAAQIQTNNSLSTPPSFRLASSSTVQSPSESGPNPTNTS